MKGFELVKGWAKELVDIMLLFIAIGVLVQIIFGTESTSYFGAITKNLMAFVDQLGKGGFVGLVALGSMSGEGPAPDAFSDHDFFVITAPGEQEGFRTGLAWLPRGESAVLVHRETGHGLKVVLPDGHLLEFAVFDLAELRVARANRYRVLLDRGGVAEGMAEVASKPVDAHEDRWLSGQLLGNLLVGGGRAARGGCVRCAKR